MDRKYLQYIPPKGRPNQSKCYCCSSLSPRQNLHFQCNSHCWQATYFPLQESTKDPSPASGRRLTLSIHFIRVKCLKSRDLGLCCRDGRVLRLTGQQNQSITDFCSCRRETEHRRMWTDIRGSPRGGISLYLPRCFNPASLSLSFPLKGR